VPTSDDKEGLGALARIASPLAGKNICKRTLELVRLGSSYLFLDPVRLCTSPLSVQYSSHLVVMLDCGRICSLGGQVPEPGNQGRRQEHLLRERRVSCPPNYFPCLFSAWSLEIA
jgi:hypothetical protein